jgi:rhamnosyltransferase
MRVLAVAVTYNPDPDLLVQVLEALAPQVQGIVVVDNGSRNVETVRGVASAVQAQLLANKENLGIATAQNLGISLAKNEGYSRILLLDQDTVLSPGVVADLSDHLTALEQAHERVAAIGPAYYELNSQKQTRAYRASGPFLSRLRLSEQKRPVESDFIIASGSLIPLAILERVGGFKEDLFIDLVDVEWCFRARAAGYKSFLSPSAVVDHRLGNGTVHVGKRQVAIHVPIRNYYWVRNALWLARQRFTPLAWKLYFFSRSVGFLAVYTTLVDKRSLRLQLICRGIRDSFRGRFGRLEQPNT